MREATEAWQQHIGDTGMIPEAVLMEEMKPGGAIPETDPPKIELAGGDVTLACDTEGSSIVYQTKTAGTVERLDALHQVVPPRRWPAPALRRAVWVSATVR